MAKKLQDDAATLLFRAAKALERASQGAASTAPSSARKQDDDLANAVFAEMAAEHLMRRAQSS